MKPTHGLRNRLVRRLHLHANMTGLFRFSDAGHGGNARAINRSKAFDTNIAGLPLAKAFIPVPELSEEEYPVPSVVQGTSPEPPSGGSQPGPARIKASPPVLQGNVFRAPETDHIALPASVDKSQPPDGDQIWHRLQNIFNKHKNKNIPQEGASPPQSLEGTASPPQALEGAASPADQSAAAETRRESLSPKPESLASNEPGMPTIQMKREAANLTPAQHVLPSSPGIQRETDFTPAEQEPGSVGASSVTAVSFTGGVPDAIKSSPPVTPPASAQTDEAAAPKLRDDSFQEVREAEQDELPPLSTPIQGQVAESPETHVPGLQALPLEAVWAVQRTHNPQGKGKYAPSPAEAGTDTFGREGIDSPGESVKAEPVSLEEAGSHSDFVRSALQRIHTSQATDSGIEFIPPRRPRPVPAPAGTNATVIESSDPPAKAPQGALQRQADAGPRNEFVASGVVPTEIGPLPEDLWTLVGAAPPPVSKEAPHERSAAGNALEWEKQPSLTSAALTAAPHVQTSPPPVVQRQVTSPAPELKSAPPAAGEDAVGEQAGEDMDIEELARQVYSELRYRLGLEWERLHRR